MKTKQNLELKDLNNFNGTEKYSGMFGVNLTDGVAYLMNNGYSWFVTDVLSIIKIDEKVKKEEFLTIKLKLADARGEMAITDGNNKTLYTQFYEYTDAKKEFQLFYTNNVLMLSSEY